MKRFFDVKLYVEGLRKIRVAGVAAAITVTALNALLPIVGIIDSKMTWPGTVRTVSVVPVENFAPFGLLMMLFALVLTHSMFSYMNERSKSDFWHAIPQKRVCVYFSFIAAIYTWIAGILLISGLLNLILWNVAKYYTAGFLSFLGSLGVYFLVSILLVGFMTLAMTLTGTTVSNLLIFALVLLFVRVVGLIFTASIQSVSPMFDPSYSALRFFEMEFFLPFSVLADLGGGGRLTSFSNAPLLIYSTLTALLLLTLGAVCYVYRKSETASRSASSRRMQHVYRCAVTLPFCLLLVYLLFENVDLSLFIIMLILILLVWVLFELMTTKKIKNVLRSLPVLVVPLVLSLLFTGAVFITRNVIWNDLPEAAQIRGVTIPLQSRRTYEDLKLADVTVEDKALKQLVADALEDTVSFERTGKPAYAYGLRSQKVVITLTSGRTMGRKLFLDSEAYQLLRDGFYNSDVYRSAYLAMPSVKQIQSLSLSNVSVSDAEAMRIWEMYLVEYSMLSDAEKRAVKEYRSYEKTDLLPKGEEVSAIYVNGQIGMEWFTSEYPIFCEYMPKTAEMVLEHQNKAMSIYGGKATDDIDFMRSLLLQAMESRAEVSGYVGVSTLFGSVVFDEFYDFKLFNEEDEVGAERALEMFTFLSELKAPDDYEVTAGKYIFFVNLSVEVHGEPIVDKNAVPEVAEDYEKAIIETDYRHLRVPVAMTYAEALTFLDLFVTKT